MAIIPTSGEFAKVPEGGSALPSVTSADNGNVLGVVDGEWNIMPGEFVFTFAGGTSPNEPKTCDKTFAEVDAAYKAGARMRPRWAGGIMFPIEADLVFFKTSNGEDNYYSGAMYSPVSDASVECTISQSEVSISVTMN